MGWLARLSAKEGQTVHNGYTVNLCDATAATFIVAAGNQNFFYAPSINLAIAKAAPAAIAPINITFKPPVTGGIPVIFALK